MGYSRRIASNIEYEARSEEGLYTIFKRRSSAKNPDVSANDEKAIKLFENGDYGKKAILYRFVRHDNEFMAKISVLANPSNEDVERYVPYVNPDIEDLTKKGTTSYYKEPLATLANIEDNLYSDEDEALRIVEEDL